MRRSCSKNDCMQLCVLVSPNRNSGEVTHRFVFHRENYALIFHLSCVCVFVPLTSF